MNPDAAGRRLLDAEDRWVRLGTDVQERSDHVSVRFPAAPRVHGGNQVREIRLSPSADPDHFLASRLAEADEWNWATCRLEIDDRTYPANLGEWLGTHEFLPQVFVGFAARASDVRNDAEPSARVQVAGTDDVPAVEALLASQQVEERLDVDEAAAQLQLQRARLWTGGATVLLAELDGRPAGHAVVVGADAFHFVRTLFVSETRRRQGVASALLDAVAERAGADSLIGLFAESATGLPDLYRGRGFIAVTRKETWIRRAGTEE